ncbi:MAG: hypothetical protein WDZ28_06075 [Simkaniaceae bacterium]
MFSIVFSRQLCFIMNHAEEIQANPNLLDEGGNAIFHSDWVPVLLALDMALVYLTHSLFHDSALITDNIILIGSFIMLLCEFYIVFAIVFFHPENRPSEIFDV